MLTPITLHFSHCVYCDSSGEALYDQHPMLQRLRELQTEFGKVSMTWTNCSECQRVGAPDDTKVLIDCEMDLPYEMA